MLATINNEMVPLHLRKMARLARLAKIQNLTDVFTTPIIIHSKEEKNLFDPSVIQFRAWTEKQIDAWNSTRVNLWTLFGGAMGGAKSVCGVRIAQRDIASSKGGVHVVMRRNYTDLQDTTKKSYDRYFPNELVERRYKKEWKCVNGWWILFKHVDHTDDPDLEKIRSLEVTTAHADEVSQLHAKFYEIMPSRLRLNAYDLKTGQSIHKYILATTNPSAGMHWTKKWFVNEATRRLATYRDRDGNPIGHNYIQSLVQTNPLLPDDYEALAFGTMSDASRELYKKGNWNISESELLILTMAMWNMVTLPNNTVKNKLPKYGGLDVGLGNPDRTVLRLMNAEKQMWTELILSEPDTVKQYEQLLPYVTDIRRNHGTICIDTSNVGKGLCDMLLRNNHGIVIPINFGSASDKPKEYRNLRAEMYWVFRDSVQKKLFTAETSDLLDEQVENTFYINADGPLLIEPKDDIKERIGMSPDEYDASVLCNYAARKFVSTVLHKSKEQIPRYGRDLIHGYKI